MVLTKEKTMSLNKDFQDIYEFYVQDLIGSIGENHTHVDVEELRSIWKDIRNPKRSKPTGPQRIVPPPNLEYEKTRNQLGMMRYDDLHRHCVRNGLQPPTNKEDMIKVILTRMYPS
jgi:hypothetical protein